MTENIKQAKNLIPVDRIESKILYLRGQKVMIDYDLAVLYDVPTKKLNEQVKRNRERFPDDFMFRLTKDEANLISQFATSNLVLRSQFATSKTVGRGGDVIILTLLPSRAWRCGPAF